ncbi:UNVERIFIED_CONTAM: Phosphate-binding protein PstS 1 [Siphonaria sp. JEL0065]|nr:Phosphate-binding protein PstS 1 [Siphonaria sp. JEL0065]
MVSTSFWRWMADFPTFQSDFETDRVEISYASVGSGIGRTDFFNGHTLFGASDSDISKSQLSFFLPDMVDPNINHTKYINPQVPQHLGNFMFPSLAAALAIVYNLPGIDGTLILNATVLGDIFCGSTTMWNDAAIQQLNPTVALPELPINVAGRGDSSGSTNIFTSFLSTYSPKFKKLIGVSSLPIWPPSFIKRSSAIELIYVCETLQNSITYVPLEAVLQANSALVKVAGIYNKNGRVIYPTVETVAEALSASTPSAFSRHQYFSITDANSSNAYPISLMSFNLLREHYYYFDGPPTPTECGRVKEMVLFWYFALTDNRATNSLVTNGWVPISGKLLYFNIQALSMITCNRVNMMGLIETELNKKAFYALDKTQYAIDTGFTFWDIFGDAFAASPVGSTIYVSYFVVIILAALIPYTVNMVDYQRSRQKEDEEDRRAKIEAQELELDETAIMVDEKDTKELFKPTPNETKAKRTNQNYLGVLSIFITMFQLVYLSLHRSIVIDTNSILVTLISYVGLIVDNTKYYAVLITMAIVWVGCLQYSIFIHPFLAKHFPFKVARLTTLHTFIAMYLPNYVAIFYNPSLELFAKALDCKLSRATNTYFNAFDPINLPCFVGVHWVMVAFSFVYTASFVFSVVRYSKSLRKNFDLKDKAWKIYFGSVIKCLVIVLFFNVPATAFLAASTVLQVSLGLAVLCWKPNEYAWYDYLRGSSLLLSSTISAVLLVFELTIHESQYNLRSIVRTPLLSSVFAILIAFTLAGFVYASGKFETELSGTEKEKQKQEIAEFFAAFVQDSLDELDGGNEDGMEHCGDVIETSSRLHENVDRLASRKQSFASQKLGSVRVGGSKNSLAQAKKLEPIIHKAKLAGLINAADAITLLKAIRNNDPLVTLLFKRCNGDFMVFKELLQWQVIQMFDERFALQGIISKLGKSKVSLGLYIPPLASAHTKLKEVAIVEAVEDE